MESFTPLASTLGGVLIGLAAVLLLFGLGRVAGISGIFAGFLRPRDSGFTWRAAFLGGLVLGGVIASQLAPELFAITGNAVQPLVVVALAGLLVGFGTRMGGGCTSGHGVCGISRLSARSMIATATFMATGVITVFVTRHLIGGGS
jgi:hypothetical protein